MARTMASPTKCHQDNKRPLQRRRCLPFSIVFLLQSSLEVVAFQNPFPVTPRYVHTWKYPCLKAVATDDPTDDRVRDIRFCSPLLDDGYPPVVEEHEAGTLQQKPLLITLPGFDGTFMTLFLQLPELSTSFDVRCLTMSMKDRSTYEELKSSVIEYILQEVQQVAAEEPPEEPSNKLNIFANILNKPNASKRKKAARSVYLMGESFGGILASDVAMTLLEDDRLKDNIKGMTLINAATCYDRSKLASMGPGVAKLPPLLYPIGLCRLLPLFTDEYSVASLILMLQAKALPSVIDTEQREAYMGRIAFSIPQKLQYMSQQTLNWRLTEWLAAGCATMEARLERLPKFMQLFRTLIVAGEKDLCLPSIGEAERLSSLFINPQIFVVEGAGHASTCGSRVDLAALMRKRFPELKGRTAMKSVAAAGKGANLGMVPRYDGRDDIGLSPLKYWNSENYRKMADLNKKANTAN